MSAKPLSFQDVIMRLNTYWAERGCLLWQPYSEKVGAGTANPATILRVLGPEPWNVAYVEPSYRPDDGRFAENPNRMQMHTQYQVILKPAPADSQELYLGSLTAIGIDRDQHDIRFVEDNWESPALGAWGLGWEVWLDGLEISQYTYFQQAGGFALDPVPVEYTYGLERIVMYLQDVREVWQIDWDGRRTYGDVLRIPEIEHCTYDFEVADVTRLKQMYDLFEAEARSALAHKLVIPAHDYVLRCSHTFNLLDTRGAIGVTERAYYFARMRDLARQVSQVYVEQRQREEYPWLGSVTAATPIAAQSKQEVAVTEPATYLLEIGTEELPANEVVSAIGDLSDLVPQLLDMLRLRTDRVTIRVFGTPRRLAVQIRNLPPRQESLQQVKIGPPVDRAFNPDGTATPAAIGFARKIGVPTDELEIREQDGKRYVFARVDEPTEATAVALGNRLPWLVEQIASPKSMRWNASGVAFSRPIRWFVSLLGDIEVPFEYAGVVAGRTTCGPRAEGSPAIEVPSADAYPELMRAHHVIIDRAQRRDEIICQIAARAAEVGGTIPDDAALLDEVTDLVEQPTALRGGFDPTYLRLPKEVLITVMKKHQRYFPVVDGAGKMLPYFVAVRNGPEAHLDVVRTGNEGVLRARYADADYFFRADSAHKLEEFTPRLATLTFQEKLGSMLDKVHRVEKLVPALAPMLGLSTQELAVAHRAASLFKSDLATQMVVELTSLQGIMGREYALLAGEEPAVARAIFEHYLPRFQGDTLPASGAGLVLGLANRLDSMVGLFAAGLAPTGSADPFGLRRDALGVVQALAGAGLAFDLRAALHAAAALEPIAAGDDVIADVLAFVRDRLYGWLRDQGIAHDVVTAVLAERSSDPFSAAVSSRELAELVSTPDWSELLVAYARCKRIVRSLPETYALAPEQYGEEATRELHAAWEKVLPAMDGTIAGLGAALRALNGPINRFFTDVLVMADDPAVRQARLALVQRIAALPIGIADLSELQGF